MSTDRRTIKIPGPLADRIARIGAELLDAHAKGLTKLPNEYVEAVPYSYVIDRAITEFEARRRRSRRSRRRGLSQTRPVLHKLHLEEQGGQGVGSTLLLDLVAWVERFNAIGESDAVVMNQGEVGAIPVFPARTDSGLLAPSKEKALATTRGPSQSVVPVEGPISPGLCHPQPTLEGARSNASL